MSSSNGTGSVSLYKKNVYVHGRGQNVGRKVKVVVVRYRVRYRYKDKSGCTSQRSKSGFESRLAAIAYLNSIKKEGFYE